MTNEQLALAIQQGKTEYIGQLWENVEKLIRYRAEHYLTYFPENCRELFSDMVNESYFALLKACKNYNPGRGAFTTCLWTYLRNSFQEVLYGGRGSREINEPLNSAISLDNVMEGTEDLTLLETLVDEDSQAEYWDIEEQDFFNSINKLLSEAINTCKHGKDILQYMLNYNATVKTAADALGYEDYRTAHRYYTEGIQQIRKYMHKKIVQKQLEAYGIEKSGYEIYMGVGLSAYKRRSHTSAVEHAVIKKVDGERRNERLLRALRG